MSVGYNPHEVSSSNWKVWSVTDQLSRLAVTLQRLDTATGEPPWQDQKHESPYRMTRWQDQLQESSYRMTHWQDQGICLLSQKGKRHYLLPPLQVWVIDSSMSQSCFGQAARPFFLFNLFKLTHNYQYTASILLCSQKQHSALF